MKKVVQSHCVCRNLSWVVFLNPVWKKNCTVVHFFPHEFGLIRASNMVIFISSSGLVCWYFSRFYQSFLFFIYFLAITEFGQARIFHLKFKWNWFGLKWKITKKRKRFKIDAFQSTLLLAFMFLGMKKRRYSPDVDDDVKSFAYYRSYLIASHSYVLQNWEITKCFSTNLTYNSSDTHTVVAAMAAAFCMFKILKNAAQTILEAKEFHSNSLNWSQRALEFFIFIKYSVRVCSHIIWLHLLN